MINMVTRQHLPSLMSRLFIVLTALRSINVRKSAGYDLFPGNLIKKGAEFLCKPIQSLINRCIATCIEICIEISRCCSNI